MSRLDVEFSVVGAEMGGDLPGAVRFVIPSLMKADRERLYRPGALRLHQRDDGRGIDPAGQECAEWHVGNHPQTDGVAQERIETLDGFVCVRRRIVAALSGNRNAAQVPEALRHRRCAFAQRQDMTGREFLSLTIDGAWLGDVGVAEITDDRVLVDGRLPIGCGAKCLELRGKDDPLRRRREIERLDAEPVARQRQAACPAVP